MHRMTLAVLVAVLVLAGSSVAMAQLSGVPQYTSATTDILGAHLNYGRGCVACHAPHSGAFGNGITPKAADTYSGDVALWGQDLSQLYGQTVSFGDGGTTVVTLPNPPLVSAHDPTVVILLCLSCHDGNVAVGTHMTGQTVEALPVYGNHAPTFLGNDGTTKGNYMNDHPVGVNAVFGCGGQYNWDCTITSGKVAMTGPASSVFANTNYGFFVSLSTATSGSTTNPVVTCTSCHDQHSQNVLAVNQGSTTATPAYYQTAFFLRGYYNPSTGGNNAAQFCRQCHGGESNEMHGQMGVKTN